MDALTNDPQAGYLAEQREPMEAMNITILRAIETYKIEGELGVKYPVPLWRDIMAIINAKITSGELIHLEGADGTIRGDALEMRKRAKLYALSLIDGMSEADLVAMAKCGGELMVSKTATLIEGCVCSNCGACWYEYAIPEVGEHCYCGARIIE